MLEYDNSAFYYFGISVSVLYLIPSCYYSGKRILFGCFFTDHLLDKQNVRSEKELKKRRQLQAEKTKLSNIFTFPFMLNLMLICLATYALVHMVYLVKDDSEIKSFDPFEILTISTGATDREIKRAYRKMSLQYHPDKNPGDSVAEAKFMMIAKAYEALTDETAKENYEKFGNPDGRQALQLSIGLPTFLLNPDNHRIIMLIYLMVLVIVIPSVVAMWYSKSKKYGDSMIMYDTYGFYNYALSEHAHNKMLPEIFAGSAEFRELPMRESDNNDLVVLMKHFKQNSLIPKMRYNHPGIVKTNLLIHAHLHREQLSSSLRSDLNVMLRKSFHLLDAMIEICLIKSWLQTTINVIEVMQNITQALGVKDSSLLQLPHFTESEVKACMGGKNSMRTLRQYILAEPDKRRGLNRFSEEEKAQVHRICDILPNVEMKLHVEVDDEENIAEGDIMTITITLTRRNIPAGETCDLVYAPEFPYPKAERWIAILGDVRSNRLHALSKITSQERVVKEKMMVRAPSNAGTYSLDLFLKSDSYLGLDLKDTVKFTIISADKLPVYEVHQEDLDLDNEPTLFEQVMSGAADSSDSEDDEDEDEDEDSNLPSRKA